MNLNDKLKTIDILQKFLIENPIEENFNRSIEEDFNLHYTHDSTAIEGNTLTLMETKVVLEGIAIGGKTIREHLEIINHAEAIGYIKNIAKDKEPFSENQIKSIHRIVLKGIDDSNAGKYRMCNVRIGNSKHIPPQYYDIQDEMQRFIDWYYDETYKLHPIIKASRVHIDFVEIHPFIDGNGRTSRLLMNLELLKSNFPIINIKNSKKMEYYEALEIAHCDNNFNFFDNLIADYMLERLQEQKSMWEYDNSAKISNQLNTDNTDDDTPPPPSQSQRQRTRNKK